MEKIVALAKRRGFVFPGSEIYGGLAGTWDYGPLGAELKNILKWEWRRRFVHGRDDMFAVESAILMNPRVWEASGHVAGFFDVVVDCKKCRGRFRVDEIPSAVIHGSLSGVANIDLSDAVCEHCGAKAWGTPGRMGGMFRTHVGPVEDESTRVFLRPETAQGMFTNFKNILDTMRPKLPFGIAQIGKAFRNEITPGNFVFRTREFEQMEIEYFVKPDEWKSAFDMWLGEMRAWVGFLGLDPSRVHEREVPEEDRAHYSRRTVDIDYDFPFGREELYGLAYRTDFDLKAHAEATGQDLSYFDEMSKERIVPHVIEPTFGVERTVLALIAEHFVEEEGKDGVRTVLKFPAPFAPVKAAVFPLLANKEQLVSKARSIYEILRRELTLRQGAVVAWDDRGNIGKRYYSQDEIGTPWCVTVDFQTLEDDTITVRDRDTMKQERIAVSDLVSLFRRKLQ